MMRPILLEAHLQSLLLQSHLQLPQLPTLLVATMRTRLEGGRQQSPSLPLPTQPILLVQLLLPSPLLLPLPLPTHSEATTRPTRSEVRQPSPQQPSQQQMPPIRLAARLQPTLWLQLPTRLAMPRPTLLEVGQPSQHRLVRPQPTRLGVHHQQQRIPLGRLRVATLPTRLEVGSTRDQRRSR